MRPLDNVLPSVIPSHNMHLGVLAIASPYWYSYAGIGVQTFGKTLVTIITALLRFLSSPNWGASWLPWTLLLRCLHPCSSLSPSSPYWNNWYGQGNSQLGLPSPKLPPRPHFSNSLLPGHPNPFQSPPSKSLHHQIWIPSQTTPRLKPYDQLTILPTFIPIKLITPVDLQAFRFLPL